ncbi:MAG: ATP-binding cassette domain-containing protein [Anaerolineae bacterium]|nr:ATP-binding cassette domain-containing protein [Anaerolineae bacterium]
MNTLPAISSPPITARINGAVRPGAIHVDNLNVTLRGLPVLKEISLRVETGEFVLISGPSGSGKSTLARALTGLLRSQEGVSVTGAIGICGGDALRLPPAQVAQQIGIVFQNPRAQLFNLTVAEELACGPRNLGLDEQAIHARVSWAADALDLTPLLPRRLDTLSGGEIQRVAIGAVLTMGSRVLILDEPTSSLDVQATRQVVRLLRHLHEQEGTTILLIEHRLGEVAHLATRVVLLDEGRLAADGPAADILQDTALLRRLGMRRPAPQPVADWRTLLEPDGVHPPGSQPLLILEGIEAGYRQHTVLKDVNLILWPGEFVALAGDNGAGKSTLALVAAGLKSPRRGRVIFNGHQRVRMGLDVGLLFQNPLDQLFCDTVDEEVAFGPHNFGCFVPDIHARTLERCDLTALRRRPVHALSAGQQQRLALAAVLALQPALLILDEPTLGQDWRHLEQLMAFVTDLNAQGTAVLMITHDYKLVHRYAHRLVLLQEGRIVADGRPIHQKEGEIAHAFQPA